MSTLVVEAKFMFLAILLYLFPPRVEIDGGPAQKIKWGTNELQVAPGSHTVTVYFPYLWVLRRAGENSTEVTVQEGQTVTVRYKAPAIVLMKGKMATA
jgi:hypothetical protein